MFPYGDIGWILANGQRSRDGRTFFTIRILSFHPEIEQRRFRVHCVRYVLSRPRRPPPWSSQIGAWFPSVRVADRWGRACSQWKHLLGAKVEIQAAFYANAKYEDRNGLWVVLNWRPRYQAASR